MPCSAYAFVTGLAYKFVKKVAGGPQDLRRRRRSRRPRGAAAAAARAGAAAAAGDAPPPLVRMQRAAPPIFTVPAAAAAVPPPPPPAPPAPPPPPPPPRTVEPARARANLRSYFSTTIIPPRAIRAEEQGTTGFRLTVGPDGRVTDCSITASSGSPALDAGDLPDPAQPRPVHAGARQYGQADHRHGRAAASGGCFRRIDRVDSFSQSF